MACTQRVFTSGVKTDDTPMQGTTYGRAGPQVAFLDRRMCRLWLRKGMPLSSFGCANFEDRELTLRGRTYQLADQKLPDKPWLFSDCMTTVYRVDECGSLSGCRWRIDFTGAVVLRLRNSILFLNGSTKLRNIRQVTASKRCFVASYFEPQLKYYPSKPTPSKICYYFVLGVSAAYHNISLDLVGLLALADTDAVALRTVLTDSSSWLDALILCPGLHRQHKAESLSNGEYPACAAMTTGYVFRVENPATVHFLQRIGRTGQLTTVLVSKQDDAASALSYTSAFPAALSVTTMAYLVSLSDWTALMYLCLLAVVRLINTVVIRRRSRVAWHGSSEPGQTGDLLVLLSYDRWVRIRGYTNDLKAVASGRWLHEPGFTDECMMGCSTLLAYVAPILVANATRDGQYVVALLLVASAIMIGMINRFTTFLSMKQRVLRLDGEREAYKSRSELARELILQSGRNDWAYAMGLITPEPSKAESNLQGPVVM